MIFLEYGFGFAHDEAIWVNLRRMPVPLMATVTTQPPCFCLILPAKALLKLFRGTVHGRRPERDFFDGHFVFEKLVEKLAEVFAGRDLFGHDDSVLRVRPGQRVVDLFERHAILRVVVNPMLLIHGKHRVEKRIALLKQRGMMKVVANLPRFFESVFTGDMPQSKRTVFFSNSTVESDIVSGFF